MEIIRLNAKNDTNGNPRRVFVAISGGKILRAWDEGYVGANAIPKHLRHHWKGLTFATTATERRDILREGGIGMTFKVWVHIERIEGDEYEDQGTPDSIGEFDTMEEAQAHVRKLPGWVPDGSDHQIGGYDAELTIGERQARRA